MYSVFEQLLQKYNITPYKVAKEAGVTQTALSNWKSGRSTPTTKTLQKIADYFGVTIDYLMTGKEDSEKEPQLKPKDKKDIREILASTEELLKQDGLMFDGDPASPEAVESILSAMQIGMEMAKKKNKEKYTPKKVQERIDVMDIKKLAELSSPGNTIHGIPLRLLINLNAIVVFYPLRGVRGFYQYFQRNNT